MALANVLDCWILLHCSSEGITNIVQHTIKSLWSTVYAIDVFLEVYMLCVSHHVVHIFLFNKYILYNIRVALMGNIHVS